MNSRVERMSDYLKTQLTPPGIPAIKQVGMFCNFGPIVELKYRNDELYIKPPQDVWDAYNGDKSIRKEQKIKMKENAKNPLKTYKKKQENARNPLKTYNKKQENARNPLKKYKKK